MLNRGLTPARAAWMLPAVLLILAPCGCDSKAGSDAQSKSAAPPPAHLEVVLGPDVVPAVVVFSPADVDSNVDRSELAHYVPLDHQALDYVVTELRCEATGFADPAGEIRAIADSRAIARLVLEVLSEQAQEGTLGIKDASGKMDLGQFLTLNKRLSPNFHVEAIDLTKSRVRLYQGNEQALRSVPFMASFETVARPAALKWSDIDYVESHEYQVSHLHEGRNLLTINYCVPKGKTRIFLGAYSTNQLMYMGEQ